MAKYQDKFINYGFSYKVVIEDNVKRIKPLCLECEPKKVLSEKCMKKNNIERHFKTIHFGKLKNSRAALEVSIPRSFYCF